MTVSNPIGATGATGATGIIGIDPTPTGETNPPAIGSFLTEPKISISDEMLAQLLWKTASDTRAINTLKRDIASEARKVAQQEEVDKLHDEADNTLMTGVTTGLMQIGSAGLQGASASEQNDADMMKLSGGDKANPEGWKSAVDAAKNYKLSGDINGAVTGMNKAAGDATNKDLEADGKTAAAKASAAKDSYENESDAIHGQRDFIKAVMDAYDALLGVKAQNAKAIFTPRA